MFLVDKVKEAFEMSSDSIVDKIMITLIKVFIVALPLLIIVVVGLLIYTKVKGIDISLPFGLLLGRRIF